MRVVGVTKGKMCRQMASQETFQFDENYQTAYLKQCWPVLGLMQRDLTPNIA